MLIIRNNAQNALTEWIRSGLSAIHARLVESVPGGQADLDDIYCPWEVTEPCFDSTVISTENCLGIAVDRSVSIHIYKL